MSTLLKQVAQPRSKSTYKRFNTGSKVCECGSPKESRSIQCNECSRKKFRPPELREIVFIVGEPCRLIPLGGSDKYSIVDAARYDELMRFKWHIARSGNTFYAIRTDVRNSKPVTIRMHREILVGPD